MFETGNQFWKQRSKHGRDKLFASPELLWDAAVEYFQYTDQRKLTRKDWVGKDAQQVDREFDVPYTLTGLCLYFDCSREWWTKFKDTQHLDFLPIIARIDQIIYNQKFEGAAAGIFNANIIARDLGLQDKNDITTNGKDLNASIQIEIINKSDQVDKTE